jgi:hypothetical protein
VVDCRSEGEPSGHRHGEPGDPAPGTDSSVESIGSELHGSEDGRAGTGRGGAPRRLSRQSASNGFVGSPGKRPLDGHPERDDREVEQ